jgi:hypothetical protein
MLTFQNKPCILPAETRARMSDHSSHGETGSPTMVANYVATMSADLASIARQSGLDTLGYLLEMVRLEAENLTRHAPHHNGRS